MSKLKTKIQSALKSGKIRVFFLFVLFAFSILLLTKLSKDYTKTVPFKVALNNLPEDKLIFGDSTHAFNITIRTYGFNLLRYYVTKPNLSLDVANIQNKNNHFLWTASAHAESIRNQFSPNVQIINIQPDSLKFMYDKLAVKQVPIVFNKNISYAKGFDVVGNFILKPDSVKVIGPKFLVDTIHDVKTQTLSLNNVKEPINKPLNLIAPEPISDLKLSKTKITVIANIDQYTEGSIQVPIKIINIPKNVTINYFPKKVTVLYNASVSNYNAIQISDFKVECDYSKLLTNASYLIPEITEQPDVVKTARINQKKIEFIVSK